MRKPSVKILRALVGTVTYQAEEDANPKVIARAVAKATSQSLSEYVTAVLTSVESRLALAPAGSPSLRVMKELCVMCRGILSTSRELASGTRLHTDALLELRFAVDFLDSADVSSAPDAVFDYWLMKEEDLSWKVTLFSVARCIGRADALLREARREAVERGGARPAPVREAILRAADALPGGSPGAIAEHVEATTNLKTSVRNVRRELKNRT